MVVAGLLVGLLALGFREATDRPVDLVLFSGQNALPAIAGESTGWVLLLVVVAKGLAYSLSLGAGFRGGPVFPSHRDRSGPLRGGCGAASGPRDHAGDRHRHRDGNRHRPECSVHRRPARLASSSDRRPPTPRRSRSSPPSWPCSSRRRSPTRGRRRTRRPRILGAARPRRPSSRDTGCSTPGAGRRSRSARSGRDARATSARPSRRALSPCPRRSSCSRGSSRRP